MHYFSILTLVGASVALSRPTSAQAVPEVCVTPFGKPARDSLMINIWLADSVARAQGRCPIGYKDKVYPMVASSSWRLSAGRDDFTDENFATVSTSAISAVPVRGQTLRPTLLVRCKAGDLDAFLNVGVVVDDDAIQVRFDDRAPESVAVVRSTDIVALFAYDPLPFVRSLRDARRLRVRLTPYVDNPVTLTFNLTGFTNHLAALRRVGCNLYERLPEFPPKH